MVGIVNPLCCWVDECYASLKSCIRTASIWTPTLYQIRFSPNFIIRWLVVISGVGKEEKEEEEEEEEEEKEENCFYHKISFCCRRKNMLCACSIFMRIIVNAKWLTKNSLIKLINKCETGVSINQQYIMYEHNVYISTLTLQHCL